MKISIYFVILATTLTGAVAAPCCQARALDNGALEVKQSQPAEGHASAVSQGHEDRGPNNHNDQPLQAQSSGYGAPQHLFPRTDHDARFASYRQAVSDAQTVADNMIAEPHTEQDHQNKADAYRALSLRQGILADRHKLAFEETEDQHHKQAELANLNKAAHNKAIALSVDSHWKAHQAEGHRADYERERDAGRASGASAKQSLYLSHEASTHSHSFAMEGHALIAEAAAGAQDHRTARVHFEKAATSAAETAQALNEAAHHALTEQVAQSHRFAARGKTSLASLYTNEALRHSRLPTHP